jgi:hypothetical protein
MQKKLRALLPGDYRKEWRKYRPADASNLRFKRLRGDRKDPRCDNQQNTVCSETSLENDSNTRSPQSSFHLESFEGPLSAFRNYSSQDTGTATPMPFGPVPFSTPISQSQLVVPSRLLLDGSTVGGWWPTSTPNGEPLSIFTPVPATTSTCRDSDISGQGSRQAQPASRVYPSSVISFHSLEQRISDRSSSFVRHVHSVLRCSIVSSWGSNSSHCSSWWSRESLANAAKSSTSKLLVPAAEKRAESRTKQEPPTKRTLLRKEQPHVQNSQNQDGFLTLSQLCVLSEGEQTIWNEMIDETRVAVPSKTGLAKCDELFMSPRLRYCRKFTEDEIGCADTCECCLAHPVHWLAGCPGGISRIKQQWRHLVNKRDVYDHTPLHFAAASRIHKADIIRSLIALIKLGADILAVNTSGDTFLHTLLTFVKLSELQDYFPLFRFLATINFPFCQRDYHGRTPLHVLFERCRTFTSNSFEGIQEMFDIMKPEIESMDNIGRNISYYLNTRSANLSAQGRAAEILSKYRTWQNYDINFQLKLGEAVGNWQIWNDWVDTSHRSIWVDLNGDTALIALIKYWDIEYNELLLVDLVNHLVENGAQINSRDRAGDTPLAIASMRGLRLVVTVLLSLGASVHSYNYRRVTVLKQACKSLSKARKRGDDRLYASILSCVVLLVDSGARRADSVILQSVAAGVTYDQLLKLNEELICQTLNQSGFI